MRKPRMSRVECRHVVLAPVRGSRGVGRIVPGEALGEGRHSPRLNAPWARRDRASTRRQDTGATDAAVRRLQAGNAGEGGWRPRIEPPVSVPSAPGRAPRPVRRRSRCSIHPACDRGSRDSAPGGNRCPGNWMPKANSCGISFPRDTAPCPPKLGGHTVASDSGTRSARTSDPAVVGTPAVAMMSLYATGIPSRGRSRVFSAQECCLGRRALRRGQQSAVTVTKAADP